jgi:hypothetical protein
MNLTPLLVLCASYLPQGIPKRVEWFDVMVNAVTRSVKYASRRGVSIDVRILYSKHESVPDPSAVPGLRSRGWILDVPGRQFEKYKYFSEHHAHTFPPHTRVVFLDDDDAWSENFLYCVSLASVLPSVRGGPLFQLGPPIRMQECQSLEHMDHLAKTSVPRMSASLDEKGPTTTRGPGPRAWVRDSDVVYWNTVPTIRYLISSLSCMSRDRASEPQADLAWLSLVQHDLSKSAFVCPEDWNLLRTNKYRRYRRYSSAARAPRRYYRVHQCDTWISHPKAISQSVVHSTDSPSLPGPTDDEHGLSPLLLNSCREYLDRAYPRDSHRIRDLLQQCKTRLGKHDHNLITDTICVFMDPMLRGSLVPDDFLLLFDTHALLAPTLNDLQLALECWDSSFMWLRKQWYSHDMSSGSTCRVSTLLSFCHFVRRNHFRHHLRVVSSPDTSQYLCRILVAGTQKMAKSTLQLSNSIFLVQSITSGTDVGTCVVEATIVSDTFFWLPVVAFFSSVMDVHLLCAYRGSQQSPFLVRTRAQIAAVPLTESRSEHLVKYLLW